MSSSNSSKVRKPPKNKVEIPKSVKVVKDEGYCLSMWQPWASLLVYGIKRLEGRSWYSEYRGRLWIHAASKEVDQELIESVESQYAHLKDQIGFPKKYPTSALLGYVDVISCPSKEELEAMKAYYLDSGEKDSEIDYWINESNESEYTFVCVNPRRLVLPLQMSGDHKICMYLN